MRLYFGQPGVVEAALATVNVELAKLTVVLSNTSGSPAQVRLHLLPPGTAAAAARRIIPDVTVPANSVALLEFPAAFAQGDVLSGKQNTSGAVTVLLDGEPKT